LGGAAFHFDTTLGYFTQLSRSKVESAEESDRRYRRYSGLERALGSFDRAEQLIREVYESCFAFGLERQHVAENDGFLKSQSALFAHVDTSASQPVTVQSAIGLIAGIRDEIVSRGSDVFLHSPLDAIRDGIGRRWLAIGGSPSGERLELEADAVVLAVGKIAMPWVLQIIQDLSIAHKESQQVDIGVRIETSRERLDPLVGGCHNPKLSFLNDRRESVRTFCVTVGGRLMQYEFMGFPVLEGQHCMELPTQKTNMGVVTSLRAELGESGTHRALAIGRRVREVGRGKPVVQSVGSLLGVQGWASGDGCGHALNTSLIEYTEGDLRDCLPDHVIKDIVSMLERLNDASPGCIQPDAILAAPVIERIYPEVILSPDMETSQPGIFMVGDCSSKIIGITYGAATGIAAARAIIAQA
jgi:uncharacterized FAD-dependent dehydrogenase